MPASWNQIASWLQQMDGLRRTARGGMMSFLALKRGFPARAAAVVGAVFDGEAFAQRAPKVIASVMARNPDYPSKGVALLRELSAMNWPEQVSVPLLIIHGANDQEVPATEAMTFAKTGATGKALRDHRVRRGHPRGGG